MTASLGVPLPLATPGVALPQKPCGAGHGKRRGKGPQEGAIGVRKDLGVQSFHQVLRFVSFNGEICTWEIPPFPHPSLAKI